MSFNSKGGKNMNMMMHQKTAAVTNYFVLLLALLGVVDVAAQEGDNNNAYDTTPPPPLPANGQPIRRPPPNKRAGPVFGTLNGYDVGGDKPVCWESSFSDAEMTDDSSDNSTATSADSSLEILNEKLFDAENYAVRLLPSCPDHTTMFVTPLQNLNETLHDQDIVKIMYMERKYQFHLEVQVDLYSILKVNHTLRQDVEKAGVLKCHARLRLCDALNQGFCNPLTDTNERDQNLTFRSQTDLTKSSGGGENSNTKLPQNDSKWNYTEGTTLLGIWGDDAGRIVDTRWIQLNLEEENEAEDFFTAQVDISLLLPRKTVRPGTYFMLGHVVLYFELDDGNFQRLDVAQTIPDHIVQIRPPPTILTVTTSAKIWLGIVIGLLSLFALYCLGFILKHRSHDVMKLAQGSFLAAMAATCLVQTVFSFTFIPRHAFCHMRGLLVRVPLTFLGAILVGRAWRTYSILNMANALGRPSISKGCLELYFVRFLDFLASLHCNAKASTPPGSPTPQSLRRVIPTQESWRLIILLTLPQLILQVVGVALVTEGLDVQYTDNHDAGRILCSSEAWLGSTGTGIAAFVYFLAVLMAYVARDLPSAFNEKDQIFNASVISSIVAVMSIVLGHIADAPTTSPDVVVSRKPRILYVYTRLLDLMLTRTSFFSLDGNRSSYGHA